MLIVQPFLDGRVFWKKRREEVVFKDEGEGSVKVADGIGSENIIV